MLGEHASAQSAKFFSKGETVTRTVANQVMPSKRNSRLRKLVRSLLSPLAKPVARIRYTAGIISPSPRHGLRLLFNAQSEPHIQSQPDVYPFAAYLAERFKCTHVIAIGRPTAKDLIHLFPRFKLVGIVPSAAVTSYRKRYRFATWLEENTTLAATAPLTEEVVKRALVVSDLDQFDNPESALQILKTAFRYREHILPLEEELNRCAEGLI